MSAARAHAKHSRRCLVIAAMLWVAGSGGVDAQADLYRCQRPDGTVVYTDSQATCPGASEHQPRGDVQSVEASSVTKRRAPAYRLPGDAPDHEAMREAHWRQKKLDAQRELAQISGHIVEREPYVKICNRGGYLYRTQDNGLKKKVSCDGLRADVAELERQRTTLRAYLDHGLRDECRTAGCLPGWLR
jgi:hypothetical protein